MSPYRVYVTRRAWAEIRDLPGNMRQRIRRAVDDLAADPRPAGSAVLRATHHSVEPRRLRIDRWRVVYAISEDAQIIDILAVCKRPPYDYGDLEALLERVSKIDLEDR